MDIHHRSHAMNLWGNGGGPSETFTPFVRITNSYNGSRALRIDVGFLREHCSNGLIFEQEAAKSAEYEDAEAARLFAMDCEGDSAKATLAKFTVPA